MIYQNIEFFNVAEINDGILYRFPKIVCENLGVPEYDAEGNYLGNYTGHLGSVRSTYGAELRFRAKPPIRLVLETEFDDQVTVYNGDFLNRHFFCEPGKKNEFVINANPATEGVKNKSANRFDKDLWRISINGNGYIRFVSLEADDISLPKEGDAPKTRLLVYGSSISQGVGTPFPVLNYVNVGAQLLGIDVLNKAVSGGCFCEEKMVEYLMSERFDAVYLEAGTNIADRPYEIIEERVGRLIDTVCAKNADKNVFIMTPIRGLSDVSSSTSDYRENFTKSRKVIEEHAKKFANTVLLDGHKLLNKDYYLAADILHPSEFGHVMMGVNFAKMLGKYIKK